MTAHNHSESAAVAMPPVLHGGDATPTQIIRAAAGAPAVVQRRGTVLVLVIGVLALMAIVVVVYTTLGQADRRASAALVRQTRIDDQGSAIAGYIAGVIGKDRLKGSFEYDSAYRGTNAAGVVVAGGSQPRFIRAHTTAPSILPLALSVDPSRQTAAGQTPTTGSAALAPDLWPLLLFSNDGSVTRPWRDANTAGNLRIDPRYATTPWLASSEPTWLDQTNQGVGLLGNEPWLQMRDWASLSNIAPSGNPVNLVNLRGNFAAESGLGASGPGAFRMTSNLWIYNAAGTPVRVIPGTTTLADLNFPAHWFANQARSFRSILDGTFVAGDSRAVGNMFADADGDGFADSRWVELVDISDPVAPRSVLPVAGPARLFVGCRIVDLSGKVNVNTATQFRTAPTLFEPAGNTPADVDLERLLTAIDFLPPLSGNAALTYDALRQPAQPYSQGAANSAAGNYENPNAYGAVAFEVGGSAFAAMTDAKIPGVTILPGVTYQPRTVNRGFGPFQTDISNSMFWDVQDRSRSYFFGGAAPSGAILRELQDAPSNNNPNIFAQQFSFGAADELELRTFERVNNPGTTSRLELAAGGRAEDYKNLSPLRDNRGLDIEKLSRLNLDEALFHAHIDMRQRLSVFGGASPLRAADATGSPDFINATTETKIDINALMARLHKPTVGSTTAGTERAEAVQEIFRLVSGALAPYAYEPSAANSNTIAWTSADGGALTQGMQLKGLAYGGDCEVPGAGSGQRAFAGIGPERALRIAAHFTANLVDGRESFDSFTPGGGTPIYLGDWASEFMLRLDGTPNFRNRLNSIIRYGTGSNEPEIFPAWESPNREVQYVTTAVQKPRMAVALNPSAAEDARLAPIATDILPPNAAAAPPSTQIGAQAINVYGIKPQPFLTQMSSITVYTDTPRDDANSDWMDPAGPDGDEPVDANQPPGPTNPPAQPNRQITIHGRVAADNPDYICEVVAFQLHNPFDTTLALTTAANEQGVSGTGAVLSFNLRHYVEFAGRYFAVADSSDRASFTTGEMKNVTLSPGETRTFYIIDQSFEAIEARMRRVDSNLTAMDAQTLLRDWINKQFSINFADQNTWPVRMAEINVGTLTAEPVSPMVGILNNTADPATTENFRQARLWSVVRVVNGEGSGAQINSPFNDVLVDRLRDPGPVGTVTLDRRLPSQQNEVAGSEDQSGNNKGLTIAMWGQVRRPQLPDGITLTRGVLPPWCVEVKSSLPEFGGGGDARWVRAEHVRSLNKANTDPVSGSLNWGDFQGGSNTGLRLVTPPGADATFPGGLFRQTAGAVEVTFTREPSKQTGNRLSTLPTTLPGAALGTNLSGVPFPQVQIPLLLPPPRSATVVRDAVLGQSYSNKRTYEQDTRPISQKLPQAPTLRPTDLLLTPAFGPSKNPSATIVIAGSRLDITDPRCYDVQWTTLAEAAALALDYDSPADNRDPDYRIGAVVTDLSQVQGCLDRGQLMADRFVPFTDRSGTTIGTFDTPVDANRDGINEQGDVPRGRGLPFAVALLDRFKFNKYGSETAMVHGVVNISTAPLAVKRVLPMLSPEPTLGWMGGGSLASDPFFDGTDADDPFDLAATLEAYGTRSRVRTRTTNGTNAGLVIDFRNDNDGGTFDPGAGVPFGRSFITGIGALRQEPGFAATAEVLVANQADVRPGEGTVAQNELDRRRRTSMDRLARDGVAFAIPQTPQADVYASGVAPYAYRAAPTGGGLPLTASLVVDDPSEKTALANALLNTISVRSDVFCAWFVVQGYTPADVDGLTAWTSTGNPPNEDRYRAPMTPSIQRRFVMVVDRSNVLSAGDKPKILMLEEVPFE